MPYSRWAGQGAIFKTAGSRREKNADINPDLFMGFLSAKKNAKHSILPFPIAQELHHPHPLVNKAEFVL